MTRSAAVKRMHATRHQASRLQRETRLQWNDERLTEKSEADARMADEIATRVDDRLEALAEVEQYLRRLSEQRRNSHLAERDRLCSDVTRIVMSVNAMFDEFQKQSKARGESLVNCRKDVASMLDEFQIARENLRKERLKFRTWLKRHLAHEATRMCREDFPQR